MRVLGPVTLTDSDYSRLLKLKASDGFADKDWTDWFKYKAKFVPLEDSLDEKINKNSELRLRLWMQNFAENLTYYRTAKDNINETLPFDNIHNATELLPSHLKDTPLSECVPVGPTVIIGRGPSVWKHKHLQVLREWGNAHAEKAKDLAVLATDGMLLECLKAGITPDNFPDFFSISVDGDRRLIKKWYGDDEDPNDAANVELFNKYAKDIKVIAASTVANNVVKRCLEAGSKVYLFHPIFDNATETHSFTRMMMLMTETKTTGPYFSVHSLGNSGSLAWVMSWILLRRSPILLTGFDFGYLPETKVEDTSYASKALTETEDLSAIESLMELENPYDHVKYKTDGVFMHYRKSFIDTLDLAPPPVWVRTLQCTGGGNLWGHKHLEWMSLAEGLKELEK